MCLLPTIRLATCAEIARMVELINAAFSVETFLEGPRTDENHLEQMMQKGIFLLSCDAEGITGCVYVEVRGERGYSGMLAVDPARQGGGIGRALVEAAESYCRERGCAFMDLSVLNLRPELPPLYRKLGYTESGADEFHPLRPLKPGFQCHLILMSKAL